MKHFANTKRREVQFKICNWVMVQLRPHRQPSVPGVRTSYSKLAKCFYRPYQVLYQIGKVAYKLQLPEGSHIHSIFHYFVLKPFHQTSEEDCVPRALSSNDVENQPVISPLAIMGTQWAYESTDPKLKVLVQWIKLSPDDTTWKDWEELKTAYHLEDKVLLDGARDDRKESTIGSNGRPKRKIKPLKNMKDFI